MDFRSVAPSSVTWATWSRGQPVARTRQGGKVVVQTPACACTVSLASPGMYRIQMMLNGSSPVHAAFCEWLGELEEAAGEAPELASWKASKGRSTCVYNNTMRLMAFSDTMAFDESGKMSADLMTAKGCACIVELQGCWTSDSRWGLRWRVVQVKFSKEAPVTMAFVDDDDGDGSGGGNGGGGAAAFAFMDDA